MTKRLNLVFLDSLESGNPEYFMKKNKIKILKKYYSITLLIFFFSLLINGICFHLVSATTCKTDTDCGPNEECVLKSGGSMCQIKTCDPDKPVCPSGFNCLYLPDKDMGICDVLLGPGESCEDDSWCKSGSCVEWAKCTGDTKLDNPYCGTTSCAATHITPTYPPKEKVPWQPIAPKLQINIPTWTPFTPEDIEKLKQTDEEGNVYIPFIGLYIAAIYRWAVGIAALVAVVFVIWGGFLYLTSGGNAQRASEGKDRISHALFGLLLLLGSYVLLYTINPDLVRFKSLKVKVIERKNLDTPPFFESGATSEAIDLKNITLPPGSGCGKNLPQIAKALVDGGPICNPACSCANFVSGVLKQSGCDSKFQSNSAAGLIKQLKELGWAETSSPQPGDILYYGDAHVTIVYQYDITNKTMIDSSVKMTACWPKDKTEQILNQCTIDSLGGEDGFWAAYDKSFNDPSRIAYSQCIAKFDVCPPLQGVEGNKCNYCNKLGKNMNANPTEDCSSRQCIKITKIDLSKKPGFLSNPYK